MNKTKKYKLKLDYTAEELKELKELRKHHDSPVYAISELLIAGTHGVENLQAKYFAIGHEDEFDFMADINNVVMGTAVFPNKLYIVHDTNTNSIIYHDDTNNKLIWAPLCFYLPAKKTKDEWLEINPAYETMLEKVEE